MVSRYAFDALLEKEDFILFQISALLLLFDSFLDMTRNPGTWTESLNSPDLQNLLGSFNIQIPDDASKCSFAKILLEEFGLDEFIKEIKSLAWRVVLCNNFKETGTKPGTVYVFEVFVKHVKNQVVIEEKVSYSSYFWVFKIYI